MNSPFTRSCAVFSRQRLLYVLLLIGLMGMNPGICLGGPKSKGHVNQAQRDAAFQQLFQTVFRQWDSNHDGKLEMKEIDTVINNPQIQGNDAAIAVVLRSRMQPENDDDNKSLTLAEVLDLAKEPGVQRIIDRRAWHIQAINHSLFLPGDPNLATFHQGRMGDCYFLAVIGAYAYHHPELVRNMIRPLANGGYEVQFGNGQVVSVAPMTDAELLMGATEGSHHGIWLSVLEKAFAQVHKEAKANRTGTDSDADDAIVSDLIGHGGYYSPVIKLLTGHQPASPPLGRWLEQGQPAAMENMGKLLTEIAGQHRLIAVTARKDKALPRGIPHGHTFAILEYNPSTGSVLMFNPWGNHFQPTGRPGFVNGYPIQHGLFQVPIGDFVRIFTRLSYETDKPGKL